MSTFHCAQTLLNDHDYAVARAMRLRGNHDVQRQTALNNLDREAHYRLSCNRNTQPPAERLVKKPVPSNTPRKTGRKLMRGRLSQTRESAPQGVPRVRAWWSVCDASAKHRQTLRIMRDRACLCGCVCRSLPSACVGACARTQRVTKAG